MLTCRCLSTQNTIIDLLAKVVLCALQKPSPIDLKLTTYVGIIWTHAKVSSSQVVFMAFYLSTPSSLYYFELSIPCTNFLAVLVHMIVECSEYKLFVKYLKMKGISTGYVCKKWGKEYIFWYCFYLVLCSSSQYISQYIWYCYFL